MGCELKGLVFVIDWDEIAHDTDRFTDEVFKLGFIKEVDGPFINGAIAITVDVDDAIERLKLPGPMIRTIAQKIDAVVTGIYKRHKGRSVVNGRQLQAADHADQVKR
jgi:hypothetical protein